MRPYDITIGLYVCLELLSGWYLVIESTESDVVTAQSTAHEAPEDGSKYRPKHVGATSQKCFNMLLSILSINVN
jgi:hypothetical protein